jgi:hypothetical protein
MKRLLIAALISAFAAGPALAADAASSGKACATTSVDKNKKALAGAAKTQHMKSCCTKAANDAKLKGAAKTSFINACEKVG